MIDAPGIYNISATEYNSDPCVEPSLSASIASCLCLETPAHAKVRHPRLTEQPIKDNSDEMDIGTAAHALMLEGVNIVEVIDAPDWRTNKAKEARDAARIKGKVPILTKNWLKVLAMVEAAHDQLKNHMDSRDAFFNGKPEQTLIWNDDGAWCRARLDWLHDSYKKIYDLKTTGISANPEIVSRAIFTRGMDIQCAFYLRGVKVLTGIDATFKFVVQETVEPYALCVIALGPDSLIIGEKKVMWALDKWRECLRTNEWPGYPRQTCYARLPEWEEKKWLEREMAQSL